MSWFSGSFGKGSSGSGGPAAPAKSNDHPAAHEAHKVAVSVTAPPGQEGSAKHSLMDSLHGMLPGRRWTEVHNTTEVPAPHPVEPNSRRGSELVHDGPEKNEKNEAKGKIGLSGKAFNLFRGSTFALPGEPQRLVPPQGAEGAAAAQPAQASGPERGGFSFSGTRRTTSGAPTSPQPQPLAPAASAPVPGEESAQTRGGFSFTGERRRAPAPAAVYTERAPGSPAGAPPATAGSFFLQGERRTTATASPRALGAPPSPQQVQANQGAFGFLEGERRRTMSESQGDDASKTLSLAHSASFFRNFTRMAPTPEEQKAITEQDKQRGGFVFPVGERRSRKNSEAEDAQAGAVVAVDPAAVADARARGGFGFVSGEKRRSRHSSETEGESAGTPGRALAPVDAAAVAAAIGGWGLVGERRTRRTSEGEEKPTIPVGHADLVPVDATVAKEALARGGFSMLSGERRHPEGDHKAVVGHADLVPVDPATVAAARAGGGFGMISGERRERSRHSSETEGSGDAKKPPVDPEATAEARARGGFGFMSGERSREYHHREAVVQPQFAAAAALVAGESPLKGFSFPKGEKRHAEPAAPAPEAPPSAALVKSDVPSPKAAPKAEKDFGMGGLGELDNMHEAGGVRAIIRSGRTDDKEL
eukprot:tig00001525_g9234.t1